MSSDKLTHMTHLSLLVLLIGDWNCRPGQSSQWAHCSCWDTQLSLTCHCEDPPIILRFSSLLAKNQSHRNSHCCKKIYCPAWGPVTKESLCFLSSVCVCMFVYIYECRVCQCVRPQGVESMCMCAALTLCSALPPDCIRINCTASKWSSISPNPSPFLFLLSMCVCVRAR